MSDLFTSGVSGVPYLGVIHEELYELYCLETVNGVFGVALKSQDQRGST